MSSDVPGKRGEVLLDQMMVIEMYTLNRALPDLTQDEFDWEPHPGAYGIRRREDCTTPDFTGTDASDWVADADNEVQMAADRGEAIEPMATIGWLLNHIGAAPGLMADLTIVGGPTEPTMAVYEQMWSRRILPEAEPAVVRFKEGWAALARALRAGSDDTLDRDYEGHPWTTGHLAVAALLNEISHHGTQICMLRDLYAHR